MNKYKSKFLDVWLVNEQFKSWIKKKILMMITQLIANIVVRVSLCLDEESIKCNSHEW